MEMARARLLIRGRVQGVFYRAFTEEVARSLGLGGWVRNTPDGAVEAMLEGPRDSIEKAVENCRSGPPAARVDDIDLQWLDYKGEFGSFNVRFY